MNITNLKLAIAAANGMTLPTLMLVRQKDQTSELPTPWLSHWDNDKRVRISLHEDVAKKIKETPDFDGLSFKTEKVAEHGEVKEYTRVIIINPTSVEMTF